MREGLDLTPPSVSGVPHCHAIADARLRDMSFECFRTVASLRRGAQSKQAMGLAPTSMVYALGVFESN